MERTIINKKKFQELIDTGVLEYISEKVLRGTPLGFGAYKIAKRPDDTDEMKKFPPEIRQLITVEMNDGMVEELVREEGITADFEDMPNPNIDISIASPYFVPEWMFEDRQEDLKKFLEGRL